MVTSKWKVDKPFLMSVGILAVVGFFIFSSASLGLLAKSGVKYSSVAFSQTFFGLFLGSLAMLFVSRMNFKLFRKYAFYFFLIAVILCILVLIPGIGYEYGGARRWFQIAGVSLQPAEILKLSFVIYFAAWAASKKDKMKNF